MIVSQQWLADYVNVDMPVDQLTDRLTMTGLNLEGLETVGDDTAIDLEVTSNRPDCLGHIGVAREISVLFDRELCVRNPEPPVSAERTADVTSVTIECEDLCPQYVARVIRGVKVGPSPEWLQERLRTLGIAVINNIVDITNYVLMECGQPLHAFDFDKLSGPSIVVRRANKGEKIVAIDQREYEPAEGACVIADAERPVAIAGVMGGLDTEISDGTTNVLIETATFAPLSVRATARQLSLHSPSSFRFERTVDRHGIDWASRRCCELILESAGGELLDEPIVAGSEPDPNTEAIPLRFAQVPRMLGIDVPEQEIVEILVSLGLQQQGPVADGTAHFVAPSWRRDLRREIDLVEEVARIHGYDRIPDTAPIPVVSTSCSSHDRVVGKIRDCLTALGLDEAITLSFVSREQHAMFTPPGTGEPLTVDHSSRTRENILRQSLIPSLLTSRRENERHGSHDSDLFELAKVYLDTDPDRNERKSEPTMIGLVQGDGFFETKGVVERLCSELNPEATLSARPSDVKQFIPGRGAELSLGGRLLGWMGELSREVTDGIGLRDAVTVAELYLHVLEDQARSVSHYRALPAFPSVSRDLNFVLAEDVTWESVESCIRAAAGSLLDSITFGGQYRGKQIDADKKSYVATIHYRSPERTLTAEEVDDVQSGVIQSCSDELQAQLR